MFDPVDFLVDGERYVLVPNGARDPDASRLEPVTASQAQLVLARALCQDRARRQLRSRLAGSSTCRAWQDDDVVRRLDARVGGRLREFTLFRHPRLLPVDLTLEIHADDLLDSISSELTSAGSWIEVVVVDDNDDPCPYVEYEIEFSDGCVRSGKTNEHGVLRYESIDAGTCALRLTSLDAESWELA